MLRADRFLAEQGNEFGPLLIFATVIGFGGAVISLLISKPMAKWTTERGRSMGQKATPRAGWCKPCESSPPAHRSMPEVAIYEGAANAFAAAAIRNSVLVAVSTELLQSMTRDEDRLRPCAPTKFSCRNDIVTAHPRSGRGQHLCN